MSSSEEKTKSQTDLFICINQAPAHYKGKRTSPSGYKPLDILLSVVLEKKSGFPFFSYYFISVEESTLTAGNTSEVSQSSISKQGMLIV